MTDYKLIADADPGGDLFAAYTALSAQTTTAVGETRLNLTGVANALGSAVADRIEDALDAALQAKVIKKWAYNSMVDGAGAGLNLADKDMPARLGSFVQAGLLSQDDVDSLLGLASIDVAKFPGLTPAHLDKARTMRSEGRI